MSTPNVIKFTDSEYSAIKDLLKRLQEKTVQFGNLYLEKIELDKTISLMSQREEKLKQEYSKLEEEHKKLLEQITQKYGEGSMSLVDGTFIPSKK